MGFRDEYHAKQLEKSRKAEFCAAVTHYALKQNIDPKALEAAYRGREKALVTNWKIGAECKTQRLTSGGIFGLSSVFTGLLYMQPNHNYISYPHDGGVKDMFVAALPFVLTGMSGLALAAGIARGRTVNKEISADVQALADGRMKQLPPPKPDSSAGLI